VEVKVDLSHKLIIWSVDGIRRASHTHEMLGDRWRMFMPYVEIFFDSTSIQWL
jgi:hypothetical protein